MCDSYMLLLRVLLLWRVRGTCGGPAGAAAMLQPALSLSQKSLQSLPVVAQPQRKRPAISRTALIQVCTCLRFHVHEKLFPGWLQWLIYAHGPGPCLSCLLLCLAPLHGDSGRQTAYSIACITAICLQGIPRLHDCTYTGSVAKGTIGPKCGCLHNVLLQQSKPSPSLRAQRILLSKLHQPVRDPLQVAPPQQRQLQHYLVSLKTLHSHPLLQAAQQKRL